jgi:hypothetical protein
MTKASFVVGTIGAETSPPPPPPPPPPQPTRAIAHRTTLTADKFMAFKIDNFDHFIFFANRVNEFCIAGRDLNKSWFNPALEGPK